MRKIIIFTLILILSLIVFSKDSTSAKIPAGVPVNTKSPEFQYKKALGAMKAGYYYTAVQHFQKAILVKAHFALAWAEMGVALHKLGFPSLGIVCLKEGLKYNPNIKWAKIKLKEYLASSRR